MCHATRFGCEVQYLWYEWSLASMGIIRVGGRRVVRVVLTLVVVWQCNLIGNVDEPIGTGIGGGGSGLIIIIGGGRWMIIIYEGLQFSIGKWMGRKKTVFIR